MSLKKIGANQIVGSKMDLIINAMNSKNNQINKIWIYMAMGDPLKNC